MTLLEAKDAAKKESKAQKNKVFFVVVDEEGEADISSKPKKDATVAAYKNGGEVAIDTGTETTPKVPTAKTVADETVTTKVSMKKQTKSNKAKKATPKGDKLTRGNNMSLTKEQWAKVDAKLKKEDVSFSAFSRGLVLKAIGE